MTSLLNYTGIGNAFADTTTTTAETAQPAAAPGATPAHGNNFMPMLMLVLFVVVFYFLLVRPQAKRAKAQKQLISSVAVGDEVMTAGGIIGRIVRLKENYVVLAIAKGVEITMQKGSISSVLPKGTMDATD